MINLEVIPIHLNLFHTIPTFKDLGQKRSLVFTTLEENSFENILGRRENTGNQHFFLIPQCFLPFLNTTSNLSFTFNLSSVNGFNLTKSKVLSFGKELNKNIYFSVLFWTGLVDKESNFQLHILREKS